MAARHVREGCYVFVATETGATTRVAGIDASQLTGLPTPNETPTVAAGSSSVCPECLKFFTSRNPVAPSCGRFWELSSAVKADLGLCSLRSAETNDENLGELKPQKYPPRETNLWIEGFISKALKWPTFHEDRHAVFFEEPT
jgi:hypothetical protein